MHEMTRRHLLSPGDRFGALTVIRFIPDERRDGKLVYLVRCDCGTEKKTTGRSLRGGARSCGCQNIGHTTHGGASATRPRHPLYGTWCRMRERCMNPNCKSYPDYGGRGIVIDPRWDDFAQFVADMGPKPTPAHSLDRVDGSGPYSPENCRWATPTEQSRNRRYCFRDRIQAILARSEEPIAPAQILLLLNADGGRQIIRGNLYSTLSHMAQDGEAVRIRRKYLPSSR